MKSRSKKIANKNSGFLLVELIVAMFIFAFIMTIAVGSFISAFEANKKSQSLKSVMNNLNQAVDEITRTLAVGTKFTCDSDTVPPDPPPPDPPYTGTNCLNGGTQITFLSAHRDGQVTYTFSPGSEGVSGYIERRILSTSGSSDVTARLTAKEVDILDVIFRVSGTGSFVSGDTEQPKVFIYIKGRAKAGPTQFTDFALQTSVSARVPDLR